VIAHDPHIPDERFAEIGVHRVDLDTLLRESDFVTLHVPLIPETRHLIDAAALVKMKPTAFLINTARGEVVDIDALVDAVRAGTIAGAGIDVLPFEPPPPDHPILHEEGILVTPHIAWASQEAGRDVKIRGAEDVVRVLRGEPPKYPANQVTPRPDPVPPDEHWQRAGFHLARGVRCTAPPRSRTTPSTRRHRSHRTDPQWASVP
jgi:D-3-phosphoglycerate dehydrogenase